jgi:replicative DNA helicase
LSTSWWVYDAIRDLHERREPADLVMTDELDRRELDEVGGAPLTSLINATTSIAEYYARIVGALPVTVAD